MTAVFFSEDISCGGCTSSIEKGLTPVAGVKSVVGSPDDKKVTVEFDEGAVSVEKLLALLDEMGFESKIVG